MTVRARRQRGPIDWDALRQRMTAAAAAAENALDPPPERARAILKARAAALARTGGDAAPAGARLDLVLFGIGRERYAIETRFVKAVAKLRYVTPLPGVSAVFVGVANFQGTVMAVLDLRRVFGVPVNGIADLSCMIVLGTDEPAFGILADAAHGQGDIRVDDITRPPGGASGIAPEYVRGVTGDALVILDGQALLDDRRLFDGKQVLSAD